MERHMAWNYLVGRAEMKLLAEAAMEENLMGQIGSKGETAWMSVKDKEGRIHLSIQQEIVHGVERKILKSMKFC